MDTGMGREGYSIIGQGKIDEILSVKSGDRREIFEEAAGISKFRHRKEEIGAQARAHGGEPGAHQRQDRRAGAAGRSRCASRRRRRRNTWSSATSCARWRSPSGSKTWTRLQDRFASSCSTDYALAQAGAGAGAGRAGRAVRRLRAVCARRLHANDMEPERLRTECAELDAEAQRGGLRRGGAAHGHRAQPCEHRARGAATCATSRAARRACTAQIAAKHTRIEELAAQAAELEEELRRACSRRRRSLPARPARPAARSRLCARRKRWRPPTRRTAART